jgi:transcriptional regulator with XRE-family HTH domain
MKIIGERLRDLRMEARYSQKQIANLCNTTQATIGRYETDVAEPPLERLLWYADFFNVSLDYIFGRTDNPNGMQKRSALKAALAEPGSAEQLMALCFTPGTPFNNRLKETVARMLREVKEE